MDRLLLMTDAEFDAHMAAVDAGAQHAREAQVSDWRVISEGEAAVAEVARRRSAA